MSQYNMNDIKVALIELDGCVYPLNRYRFNFYRNLCKQKGQSITREAYYQALGNMYTMYDRLPLSSVYNPLALNQKVETDLLRYVGLKGIRPFDGTKELIDYFNQKGVKVVVVSTHKTKDALEYLKMGGLFNQVDYVIGSDTKLKDIESGEVFAFLRSKYDVTYDQIVMVTSLSAFANSAHETGMNTIFVEDLAPASDYEKENCLVASSIDDVLKAVIHGRYEDVEKFDEMFGMSEGMTQDELKRVYDRLCQTYQDDAHMLDIINRTYEYHLSKLEEASSSLEDADNEPVEFVEEIVEDESSVEEEKAAEEETSTEEVKEYVEETEDEEPEKKSLISSLVADEEEADEKKKDDKKDQKKKRRNPFLLLLDFIIGVIYVLVLSALVILIGIIVYVAFMDYFKSGQPAWLINAYNIYSNFCNTVMKFIIDFLHQFISVIPAYDTYLQSSNIFSVSGAHIFNIYVIDTLIIGIFEIIISLFSRD